jgi:hypothetical protein
VRFSEEMTQPSFVDLFGTGLARALNWCTRISEAFTYSNLTIMTLTNGTGWGPNHHKMAYASVRKFSSGVISVREIGKKRTWEKENN